MPHIRRTLLTGRAGDLLLCYDGGNRAQTIQALRTVIPTLQHCGLTFIPL